MISQMLIINNADWSVLEHVSFFCGDVNVKTTKITSPSLIDNATFKTPFAIDFSFKWKQLKLKYSPYLFLKTFNLPSQLL